MRGLQLMKLGRWVLCVAAASLGLLCSFALGMPMPPADVAVEGSPAAPNSTIHANLTSAHASLPSAAPEARPVEPTLPANTPDSAPASVPAQPLPIEQAAEPTDGHHTHSNFPIELPGGLGSPNEWTSPEGISSAIQTLALLTVVSLAPAVLMMTTSFVRIVIVLGLLRQSLGTQQLPSNQVVTSLALFMTMLIMAPVWNRVYDDALAPYVSHEITLEEAWDVGIQPVRGFMSAQIERTGNSGDVWMFYKYLPEDTPTPQNYDDVPLTVLLPAFMLSELKTAFLIGFQIFLPFLVIDLVVSCVTISMGMFMVPPMFVSLPMKLLLFVLVDGWHLVVGMLMDSFHIVA
jgi:flagellar biosynthetic protein FliP